ncbi:2-hydroxychromene-2-carboxylate isomerase [Loktanella sp. SALINAS62]|uniref:2-hydroxychromene-2-carboxylate isomerase n=1 Tax=Loktanella sp. SALINAS62 TaxID=2706124 RepID=UPI001B8B4182|nr:2-hydroxychromene-2-carboxylate isomerase [Loktanella sp. SALINAS62]MBS1301301.1 2-hydroxychromene-2-carboxylate isomerase [Loktanella sp. SALINAS62]
MAHIDYYFATISPYTYLCGVRPAEIAAAHGATLTYRPIDLMQVFSRTGGQAPADRHPSRQDYRAQDLRRRAMATGKPLIPKPAFFPTNPAPSSYAIIAAQADGSGDLAALVAGITRACWAEDRDIASDDVIRDCLTAAGFPAALADSGLLAGAEAYHRNTEDAVRLGVFGAPFFITDSDERFWGQDRLDDLESYLAGRT